jgi:hypothetical protein
MPIHSDPRNMVMCNICYIKRDKEYEMVYIDFESLTLYPMAATFQSYAISSADVAGANTAYYFLFMQILWAVFVWTRTKEFFEGPEDI